MGHIQARCPSSLEVFPSVDFQHPARPRPHGPRRRRAGSGGAWLGKRGPVEGWKVGGSPWRDGLWNIFQANISKSTNRLQKFSKPTVLKNISFHTWIMWVIIPIVMWNWIRTSPHISKSSTGGSTWLYLHPRIPSPASKTKATLQHDSNDGFWK